MVIDEHGAPTTEAFEAFMRCVSFRLFLLRDNAAVTRDHADDQNPAAWRFHDWKALCEHGTGLLGPSLERWRNRGRDLYDSNLHWQALLGYGLTLSAMACLDGVAAWVDGKLDRAAAHFDAAARGLDDVLAQGPHLAEQGHFTGWTSCDLWLGAPHLRDQHRTTAAKLKKQAANMPTPQGDATN